MACHNKKNFMKEMQLMINEMENLKIEPEECNVSCPEESCPGQFMNTKVCGSDKNKNSSWISTCQVASTQPRFLPPESQLVPNIQSLDEICYPPVHTLNDSCIRNGQQYHSKSTPLNYLHQHQMLQQSHLNSITQSQRNQKFISPILQQESCPQSYMVSIPFR